MDRRWRYPTRRTAGFDSRRSSQQSDADVLASLLGSVVSVFLLLRKKASAGTHIPFGPFLIVSAIIVKLFGASLLAWYKHKVLAI